MDNRLGVNDIISVLVVDDDPHHGSTIRTLLTIEPGFRFIGAEVTGREGVAAAQQYQPDVVIMDINLPDMDGFEAAKQILKTVPKAGVIMLSVQDSVSYFRKALSTGVNEYLVKPPSPDELYETIRRTYLAKQEALQVPGETPPPVERGDVIVVYSPQGGVGCTTLAINIASGLLRNGARVLLLDADLQFGDVSVMLNLSLERTLYDLMSSADDLDLEYVDNFTTAHSSGLIVLPGSRSLRDAIRMGLQAEKIASLIDQLATVYDFIVVDTSVHMDEVTFTLLQMASKVVLVALPVLEAVKNTRLVLDYLVSEGCSLEQFALVLNRVSEDRAQRTNALPTEKIAAFLKQPVVGQLPADDSALRKAVMKGLPLLVLDQKQERALTKEMIRLAETLYEELIQARVVE